MYGVWKLNKICFVVKQFLFDDFALRTYSLLMAAPSPSRKGIKDIFYETRVLMGRDYTLRRFATEVLGGSVDPVMLGYIEKGTRFPH